MDPLSSDLSFNIVHTIYALFIHNYILLAYLVGLFLSIIIAIKSPSRFSLFLLLGFAVLAFSFEYDKHIVGGLREQTLSSLITTRPHYRLQKWVSLVVAEMLPILLYILGWLLIYLAIISAGFRKKKK